MSSRTSSMSNSVSNPGPRPRPPTRDGWQNRMPIRAAVRQMI
jgi:hypothetical protein